MRFLYLLALTAFALTACENTDPNDPDAGETLGIDDDTATAATTVKYMITPVTGETEFPTGAITKMEYKNGSFDFDIAGDYTLGVATTDAVQEMCANSEKGQHIHLIVNNEPYMAKYTSEFDVELPDGEHYLTAFLSRSYHMSIKEPQAARTVKATVKDNSFAGVSDAAEPMVIYSRPKGTYVGADTKNVLLDFYLANVALGSDYQVKVNINGEQEEMLRVWQPYFVQGLPMGDNTIELTLVDGTGKTVDTPLNPVKRTFTLKP